MIDTAEDTQERPGPGGVLRSTRDALGYTLQDMADAMNLTARVVRDLEDERWDKLPGVTFARGYVRAYARLLGLDGDALIDSCPDLRGPARSDQPAPRATLPARRGFADWAARQPGALLSGAVVAAVCAVLLVLYLVWPEHGAEQELKTPEFARTDSMRSDVRGAARSGPRAGTVRGSGQDMQRAATGAAAPAASAAADAEGDLAPAAADGVAIPALASERAEATGVPAVAVAGATPAEREPPRATLAAVPATVASGSDDAGVAPPRGPQSRVRRISPEGDDRVDFEFTEDCWVEVADAGGRSYSNLSRAGDSLVLVGQAPFRIRLGYGPGASVAFNGEQIALAPHTRRNVTSLVLAPPDSLDP